MQKIFQRVKEISLYLSIILFSLSSFLPPPALAQEMLPHPDQPFGGKIGLTYKDSIPDKPELLKPENFDIENPPNILLVLVDDAGFGQSSAFGGATPTPTIEALADNGLKYNQFHTTALCAPTRSALLTGHNHHSAANGALPESGTGYPGYNSVIPDSTATIGKVLHEYGYDTSWFGKNHNVPQWETSLAGPYDHWPTQLGFDYFYGFVGGSTDQFNPASLVENTTRLEPPSTNADGSPYHLSTDLADHTIDYLKKLNAVAPDKPFFSYFATGATHAPHQVPQEWVEKIQKYEDLPDGDPDKIFDFSQGWDEYRKVTFEKQKELGVIPDNAKLTERPCSLQAWSVSECYTLPGDDVVADAVSEDEKPVFTNMMEVFSAFTAHTDHEIGRVVNAIDEMGKLDNTLVFYIFGDNGSSAEGELGGLLNELSVFNQIEEEFDNKQAAVANNELGTEKYYNHFPAAWAWAMNTPFQWTKQIASHFGGTRNGMVISWPEGIDESHNGEVRQQFGHVIDIMPTILDAVGIAAPVEVNGIAQKPIEGYSMFNTFNDPDAETGHDTQYFELFGNQGIYSDGWMASAIRSIPWEPDPLPNDLLDMPWELYCIKDCEYNVEVPVEQLSKKLPPKLVNKLNSSNGMSDTITVSIPIDDDFTQAHDLAEDYPDQLDKMVKLFFAEASKYNVLPLDDRKIERYDVALRPNWVDGERTTFTYPDHIRITEGAIPDVRNKPHTITADVTIPEEAAQGMLATFGGRFGGYGLYVDKTGHLVYCYNLADSQHYYIKSQDPLSSGKVILSAVYEPDSSEYKAGATVTLYAKYGGALTKNRPISIGQGRVDQSLLSRFTIDETFDVGYDTGSPVTDGQGNDSDSTTDYSDQAYELPFEFTGTLNSLTIDLN